MMVHQYLFKHNNHNYNHKNQIFFKLKIMKKNSLNLINIFNQYKLKLLNKDINKDNLLKHILNIN